MDARVLVCLSVLVLVVCVMMAEGRPARPHETDSLPAKLNGCSCDKKTKNCGCCVALKVDVPKVKVNGTACVNLTWLLTDFGLSLTFDWNNKTIFNKKIPVNDPPPLCFQFPQAKALQVCLRLHAVSYSPLHFGGCLNLGLQVDHAKHIFPLGCIYNDQMDTLTPSDSLVPRDSLTSGDILKWFVDNNLQIVIDLIGGMGDILDDSQPQNTKGDQEPSVVNPLRFEK